MSHVIFSDLSNFIPITVSGFQNYHCLHDCPVLCMVDIWQLPWPLLARSQLQPLSLVVTTKKKSLDIAICTLGTGLLPIREQLVYIGQLQERLL